MEIKLTKIEAEDIYEILLFNKNENVHFLNKNRKSINEQGKRKLKIYIDRLSHLLNKLKTN